MSLTVVLLILVAYLALKNQKQALTQAKLQQQLEMLEDIATFDPLFRSLLSETSDAVAVVDQNLTILIANSKTQEAFESIFGQQYLPGKNVLTLLENLPIQRAIAKRLWLRALNGENFCITEAFQDHLNQQRHYEMTFTPVRNNDGEVIQALMLAKDITQQVKSQAKLQKLNQQLEAIVDTRTAQLLKTNQQLTQEIEQRQQIESELRESEERFRATFEQAAVGIAHIDATSNTLGQWLRVNQKMCEILGYSAEELKQTTFQRLTHPADLEADLQRVNQLLAGESNRYTLEKRYFQKDGSIVWGNLTVSLVRDSNHQPKYFISVVEDISERKQLEETVGQSLKRLENLHQLDRAILTAQDPKKVAQAAILSLGKLIRCQRVTIAMVDLASQTSEILFTQGHEEIKIQTNFSLQLIKPLIERLQQEKSYFIADLSSYSHISYYTQMYATEDLNRFLCVPLRAGQQLLGFVKLWSVEPEAYSAEQLEIILEISNQVAIAINQTQLYRQVREYATKLEQRVIERTAKIQEVNQELEAFTYSVSHDLRAPLRSIQGFATAILEDYSDRLDALGIDYARRLVSSANQLDQLIQDLLAYSRLTRVEIRRYPINLSETLLTVLEQLEEQIQQKQAEIQVIEPLHTVIGNQRILSQIISNLLSNALKFIDPQVKPAIRIWTEKRNANVRFWIEDNGIGIDSEHHERIFRVFERLHGGETYPGTGIGLAIVRRGIERLRGQYGVESQLGSGSRFWIELPSQESEV